MASVNGLELKAVKYYLGHEGEHCLQAFLYLDGKRAGVVSEDTWSGMYEYVELAKGITETETMLDERLFAYAKAKGFHTDFMDRGILISILHSYRLLEAELKKQLKKHAGKSIVLVAWDTDYTKDLGTAMQNEQPGSYFLALDMPETIADRKAKLTEGNTGVALVFRSLQDFRFTI